MSEAIPFIFRGADKPGVLIQALRIGHAVDPVNQCPGNVPPAVGPYFCVYCVYDLWRMNRDSATARGIPHYSDAVEPSVLTDIRRQRCVLVFDFSNEGASYDKTFRDLANWVETNELPAGYVLWVDQNRNLSAHFLAAHGSTSSQIQFVNYDFFVKAIAQKFASQQIVGLPNNQAELVRRMYDRSEKDRLLLCLNATPRLWRILTLASLLYEGFVDRSLISFPGFNNAYVKKHESIERVIAYIDSKAALAHLRDAALRLPSLGKLVADEFTEEGNLLFSKIDARPYIRTHFSLVTETEFSGGSVCRVTEKLFKPLCLGHPLLLVGNPRSLQFARNLGFSVWDDLIDHSYDSEVDPLQRFESIMSELRRQMLDIERAPESWLLRAGEMGIANITHSFSGGFLAKYMESYDAPLLRLIGSLIGMP